MHDYGITEDHFANVAVALRKHATRNPLSVMGRRGPLTREDHNESRLIADPLRLLTHVFLEGDPPVAPHPDCGFDTTGPTHCQTYNECL